MNEDREYISDWDKVSNPAFKGLENLENSLHELDRHIIQQNPFIVNKDDVSPNSIQ